MRIILKMRVCAYLNTCYLTARNYPTSNLTN